MNQKHSRHQGLILLIVLGMLSLFSLLAISFMVITSQSRRSNAGRASRDFRGTAPEKLLDDAIRPVLRGTTDPTSALYHHDLLGDIYGHTAGEIHDAITVRVRRFQFGISLAGSTQPTRYPPLNTGSNERPILINDRFLRIPVVLNTSPSINEHPLRDERLQSPPSAPFDVRLDLPRENDALTSRVATFLQGPLQGQSFPIVRYVGDPIYNGATAPPAGQTSPQLENSYSITIDLQDAASGLRTVGTTTRSLAEWVRPTGTSTPLDGLQLCYPEAAIRSDQFGNRPTQPANPIPGYQILINGAPFSSHGKGVSGQLNNNYNVVNTPDTLPAPVTPATADINNISQALQPFSPNRAAHVGDANETYDAADYQNVWLSHRKAGASSSADIIPSFHRAALINYLVNWKDPSTFTLPELIATCQRLIRATGRPLSIRITDGATPPTVYFASNPDFSGGSSSVGASQLDCVYRGQTDWTGGDYTAFVEWAQWLCMGPWDVDSDADGLYDGVWTDPNLPLTTSREGKLLKVLVSYTIESLDSRLDLAATGNLGQLNTLGVPTDDYASGNTFFPQGTGFGTAETSTRHLFASAAAYNNFLLGRYGTDNVPGSAINDFRNQLHEIGRRNDHNPLLLPGLPNGEYGWANLGLDLMGNPRLTNLLVNPSLNDPYESRWLAGGSTDSPLGISEWENMVRQLDWDRSTINGRVPAFDPTAPVLRAITPRSRHLRYVEKATPSIIAGAPLPTAESSAFDVFRQIYNFRYGQTRPTGYLAPADLTFQAFRELFPLESARGQKLNVNRPLGNGIDEDGDGNIDEPSEESGTNAFTGRSLVYDNVNRTLVASAEVDRYMPDWMVPTAGGTLGIDSGNLDPAFEALGNSGIDLTTRQQHFGQQTRQLLARHIYCLAMLVLPQELHLQPKTQGGPLTGDDRARVIAQWAVNVVDFRDADSAMTRFPYDPTPFSSTGGNYFWEPGAANGNVVWGHEQQEVILTESLATHDLRVRDTTDDGGPGTEIQDPLNPDPTYDQYRIPEPSLFLELMCLRTTHIHSPANASEREQRPQARSQSLYDPTTGELELDKLSPAGPSGDQFPVFRIAISQPHPGPAGIPDPASPLGLQSNPAARANIAYQLSSSPTTSGLAWDSSNTSSPPPYPIDRIVLFQADGVLNINATTIPDLDPALNADQILGRVFTRTPSDPTDVTLNRPSLAGGEYLLIGPREETFFGSTTAAASNIRSPNAHRVFLDGAVNLERGWGSIFDSTDTLVTDPTARPALRNTKLMIAQQPAMEYNAANMSLNRWMNVGLNVSAPYGVRNSMADGYYQRPTHQVRSDDNQATGLGAPGFAALPPDGYRDYTTNNGLLPDEPFDGGNSPRFPLGDGNGWPLGHQEGIPQLGTAENWCTAFLQRLADPERPWHREFNPYITIDWLPIDLTVFSGEEDITPTGGFQFATRQKSGVMIDPTGGQPFSAVTGLDRSFLSYATTELPPVRMPPGAGSAYFKAELPVDPGALPDARPTNSNTTDIPNNLRGHFATLGYLNSSFGLRGETGGSSIVVGYEGAPTPMPAGLFWADRPFSNALELSLVPFSAPGQLQQEFFAPSAVGGTNNSYTNAQASARFTHLLNFFQQADLTGGGTNPKEVAAATLFDLVETPSAWADTEEFVPPQNISSASASTPAEVNAANYVLRPMGAPYNKISQFVEPGKVNINDVSEPAVLQGLLWNQADPTGSGRTTAVSRPRRPTPSEAAAPWTGRPAAWATLENSRAGYDVTSPDRGFLALPIQLEIDARVPTQFAGVFKPAFSAGFVPSTRANALDASVFTPVTPPAVPQRIAPVNTTLLRQELQTGGTDQLFRADYTPYSGTDLTTRHPYYDYLPFTRLQNLVTTRSNVFSVRVTVGFFEYNSATGIGREYGIDEGTAQRHKAFYVIDRSIPVGYQEGLDLNTDQCILMRRIIE